LERQVIVNHAQGLHARPAAELVKAASRFACEIHVVAGSRTASAKSILHLLKLEVKEGQSVVLQADGPDAEEAINVLTHLLERGA
jgi:phosphotransferase system HPr (HPr) family protein